MPIPANTSPIVWEFLQWELTNDAAEASWAPTAQAYSVTLIIAEEKKNKYLNTVGGKVHTVRFTQGWQSLVSFQLNP